MTKPAIAEIEDLFDRGHLGPAEASRRGAALYGMDANVRELVSFLQEVQREHPNTPEVHEVLSRVYAAGGREDDASLSARAAEALRLARAGTLRDRLAIARTLLTAGRPDDAEVELGKALQAAPNDLDALSLLGRIKHMRGEISEAIACWESLRARSAHNEATLWHVGVLHQLAQDRRRAGDDQSVVEEIPLDRRHLAQRELERALRLAVQGQVPQSLRALDQLARREAPRDRDLLKLTVMTHAWVQDAAGDGRGACATLEALGEQAGMGTDLDRLLFLVRLYERQADPELLDRAILVYRFLETRIVKNSLLIRLARLYERRGQADLAREYRRRHLLAFQRRMGQPSLDELLGAAMLRSLTVAELDHFHFPEDERARRTALTDEPRERAILALLDGQQDQAQAIFETVCAGEWATACDWGYLGELRQRAGDADAARTAWTEALEREEDPSIRAEMLGRALPVLPTSVLAGLGPVRDKSRRRETYEALRDVVRRRAMDPVAFRQLAAFERAMGLNDLAGQHEVRASALGDMSSPRAHVGHVQAAAAYYFHGRAKGLIHEVWASRRRVGNGGGRLELEDMLGNLAPDLRTLLQNLFDASSVYVRRKFPHRTTELGAYRYHFKCTKEDELSSGASAGLPSALALISLFLDLPVPQDVALSGAVVTDAGHTLAVRRIGDAEHKVAGAYHKGLSRIILPVENRPDIEASDAVPHAIAARFVSYVRNMDETLELVFGSRLWDI